MMAIWFSLIAILVIASQNLLIFYTLPSKNKTDFLIGIFSVLMLMDAGLALYANLGTIDSAYFSTAAPFGLIYGPLLFLFYHSTQNRRVGSRVLIFHFFPAFIGTIIYIIILASSDFRDLFLQQYLILLYTTMCLSWIIYPFVIIANKNRIALLGFGLFKYGMVLLWILTSYMIPLIWSSMQSGIQGLLSLKET